MAKKATGKGETKSRSRSSKSGSSKGAKRTSVARVSSGGRSVDDESFNAGEAFIKVLQSPLVAELVAVAATAALASLAENGITNGDGSRGKRAAKAVKEAGKAAAAAVGRRLGNEIDEIRKAAKKAGAKA